MKKEYKIIFYGSTNFSKLILESLIESFNVVAIITQPDKPFGREKKLKSSPVKDLGVENNITVLTPTKLSDEFFSEFEKIDADLAVVAAYGKIIPDRFLNHPKNKSINVHGSILPSYRGATPVQSAIRDGVEKSGVTIIEMVKEMDAGNILAIEETPIENNDNVETLMNKLGNISARMIKTIVPDVINGLRGKPQVGDISFCYIKDFSFENGQIDWTKGVKEVYNHIRAFSPAPRAWTMFKGKKMFILETKLSDFKSELKPGTIFKDGKSLYITCNNGCIEIIKLQLEGKNVSDGVVFMNGYQKDLPNELMTI